MQPQVLIVFSVLLLLTPGGDSDDVVSMKCLDKERNALLHFKSQLQDPNDYLSSWTNEEETNDCCKYWSRVTCNEQTGHVLKLDLTQCDLKGEISPSLLNLTYLNHLDLSGNSFNITLPMFISSMTRLRHLFLSGSSFSGSVPSSIGSLINLRSLDLSSNSFTGTIPTSIGSLTHLSYLSLDDNNFDGDIPPALGNLTNMQKLSLRFLNSSTIENLDWLSHLSQLKDLSMDGTSLAKVNNWVNVILGLQTLTFLSLEGCDLSQVMHPYSTSLANSSSSSSSIASLSLRDNNFNSSMFRWLFPLTSNTLYQLILSDNLLDDLPEYIGNLCGLTSLSFSNNSFVGNFSDFLAKISGCTSATLTELDVSYNHLTGSLSSDIQKLQSLHDLNLYNNNLNGTISEKVWELPTLDVLDISSNSLKGAISEIIGKSKLRTIDLSNNSLEGVQVASEFRMSNISYIEYIDVSSCKLGHGFPKWILKLKNLTHLDISNVGISDTIPSKFWNMWPSRLTYLNISSNNITGEIPDLSSNFDPESIIIDLSSNNFYGVIPSVPSALGTLDLSKNRFNGGIFFLCDIVDEYLTFVDLSNNALSGPIPDCLWNFKELKVLNLGHNNLSGRIPASFQSLVKLEVLYLYSNNFSGNLPLSLKNCTELTFLDLGDNKFSGNVPVWIGENLSRLYILSLRSNKFIGHIPSQLCELVNLQILDLSMNNLNGTIPSCISNLTSMVQEGFSQYQHSFLDPYSALSETYQTKFLPVYVDRAMIQWQGNIFEFSSNLRFLNSIDLSSNNLTGQIPYELTDLHELIALNLSNNVLLGEIPQKIGELKSLLTLDLSNNNLSGGLPRSMTQMNLLNYLDMSHNNLSGRIPSSTQLQSFDPSRYTDNAGLCGPPVSKTCPEDGDSEVPSVVGENEDDKQDTNELWRWFYIGGATGFATGFWIVCSVLLVNRRVRHVFFNFVNNLENWLYVKVVVFIVNLRKVAHA